MESTPALPCNKNGNTNPGCLELRAHYPRKEHSSGAAQATVSTWWAREERSRMSCQGKSSRGLFFCWFLQAHQKCWPLTRAMWNLLSLEKGGELVDTLELYSVISVQFPMLCAQGNLNITWGKEMPGRVPLCADIYSLQWHLLVNELAAEEQVAAPPLHLTPVKEASQEKRGKTAPRCLYSHQHAIGIRELEATISQCLERILWLKIGTAEKGRKPHNLMASYIL